MKENPYKSKGRRTVIGLAEHKTKMALKDKEIDWLKERSENAGREVTRQSLEIDYLREQLSKRDAWIAERVVNK